jgi:ArsR family transcriptional regulator
MEEKSLVQEVIKSLPSDDTIYDLAELFKNFGDSTRIKILLALSKQELCVNDITKLIGVTQSAVSHQLKILKQSKLVKATKKGKEVYYALDDDHVNVIISKGLEHVNE